jgi:hypothetical protein
MSRKISKHRTDEIRPHMLEKLVAWLGGLLVATLMALSTSPALAQSGGAGWSLPSMNPLLGDVAGITPANFLSEVQTMVNTNNARDLLRLGKQAASLVLRIEELQITFLQSSICKSNVIPAHYSKEVQIGCDLLGAQGELNRVKQKALALVSN